MNDLQKQVQVLIDGLAESGFKNGVQVGVYPARRVGGKGVASTVAHVLVERDVFSYDTPVVEVWPEFGAYSKDSATLRHVLTHSAWVPAVPRDTTLEQLCDWDEIANSATGVSIAVTKNRFNPIEMNVVGQVSEIVTKTFS